MLCYIMPMVLYKVSDPFLLQLCTKFTNDSNRVTTNNPIARNKNARAVFDRLKNVQLVAITTARIMPT